MPCMARTAAHLNDGLEKMLPNPALSESDREILRQARIELAQLKDKGYPYRASLTLSYKILHYKT